MMKKRVWSMLMVLVLLTSLLSTAAFAVDEHEHEYAWTVDGSKCWQYCTVDGCTATTNIGDHADSENDSDFVCDHCGEHIHSMTAYDKNDTQHWIICADSACSEVGDKVDHTWKVDTSNTDNTKTVYTCVCGATKEEHAHVWATTLSYDGDGHWYACTNGNCAEQKDYAAHNWEKQDTSTSTNYDYKCSACGATKSEHVHVWSTSYTWNDTTHWHKCIDSNCTAISGEGTHYDYNGTGVCDAGDCSAAVDKATLTSLTITGLTEPAEGAEVGFTASVAESAYGTPTVKWNRVTNLSTGASVALGSGATFAAGQMYNTSIMVPINSLDAVSDTISITLNGQKVPFYTSNTAFNNAVAAYQGNYTAYMAKIVWSGGSQYIAVSAMFAKTPGTHTHTYGADWIETSAQHYMLCTGCGEIKDAAKHYDNNNSGLCDVCGFDMKYYNANATGATSTHTHTYGADWVESATQHWHQCTTCGATKDTANHADLNKTGKCDVCGFVMTAADGHTHTYGTDWTEDFAMHWKQCTTCGAKTEIAAHYDNNNTGLCDVCGYAMATTSSTTVAATGDANATFLWVAALFVSVFGVAATAVYMKKRKAE